MFYYFISNNCKMVDVPLADGGPDAVDALDSQRILGNSIMFCYGSTDCITGAAQPKAGAARELR
ncbi:hypothetical protein BKA93DRAFT_826427 [Sparassis latifolia]